MNLLPIFSVLLFSAISFSESKHSHNWARGTTTTPTPRRDRTRIIGGVETSRNEYPFIVSLFRVIQGSGHFCGGSLISRDWIVTAAHCVIKADFKLTAGEHDLRVEEGTEQTVNALKVIRHPNYNPNTFENDIALVKVTPPFNYTDYVKSFQIPTSHFVATGNVTTAGWGVVDEGSSEVSPVLRKVTVGLFDNIECSSMYGKDFHVHKMICAGDSLGGKDACQGDSGGPLLCDDHRFGDTLCGIVSFGFGCARPSFAGVYTKTAYYSDWISWEQERDKNPNYSTAKQNLYPTTAEFVTTTFNPIPMNKITTKRGKGKGKWKNSGVIMLPSNLLQFSTLAIIILKILQNHILY